MTKFYVNSWNCKECVYEGFDKDAALRMQYDYNNAIGDYYLNEIEIDDPEEDDNTYTTLTWYENEYLTDIMDDEEQLKSEMKEMIEEYTGKKVESFEIEYEEPEAEEEYFTFIAHVEYQKRKKGAKK